MNRRSLTAFLLGFGVLWACNDFEKHPSAGAEPGNKGTPVGGGGGGTSTGDGGTITDAGGNTTVDADANAECSNLDDPTTLVDQNAVSSDAPAGTAGGELVNGIYDLKTADKYVGISGQAGPTGLTYREVIEIKGGVSLERVRLVQQANGPLQTFNVSYVLVANTPNLTLTQKCPTLGVGEQLRYTSENGTLTLISASGESFTYVAR